VCGKTGSVGLGGGIYNDSGGTLSLVSSTITKNSAGGAPGGGGLSNAPGRTATVHDSIIAGNTVTNAGGPDVGGTVVSDGNNLIGNPTGGGGFVASDLRNVAPVLAPLALNAPGTTPTHALLPTSPAIDAGGACSAGVTTDQRGIGRSQGSACDIGAYEYVPVTPTIQPAQAGTRGQQVTFTGSGFQTGTTVTVDGAPVAIVVAADGNSFTVDMPAHAGGTVAVIVANPGAGHTAMTTLTYTAPTALPTAQAPGQGGGNPNPLPGQRPAGPSPPVGRPNPLPTGR
jgi:hypothetical protein